MSKKKQAPDFTVICDTRETNAYTFSNITPRPKVIYKKLDSADYSILGFENKIGLERKTAIDAFQSFGRNRNRFVRELERLSQFQYAGLMLEFSLSDIFKNPPVYSKMLPKSVFRSLISWSVYYNIHVWPAPDREFGEKLTYLILKFWYQKNVEQI